MPLWLDMLRTPMAAPETPRLRRMRRTWQGLCLGTAATVGGYAWLAPVLGRLAPCLAAALLVALVLYSALYLRRKWVADETGQGAVPGAAGEQKSCFRVGSAHERVSAAGEGR